MLGIKDLILNTISPPKCMACECNLPLTSKAMFCYNCSQTYRKTETRVCNICGKPVEVNASSVCRYCRTEKIYYNKTVSRYLYKGCIKEAMCNMKFKNKRWIAFEFGRALYETVLQHYSDIDFDMILYVPMTPLSEIGRGFNQAGDMAAIISEKIKVPIIHNILYKNINSKTQSGLNRKDRFLNMRNAFYLCNTDRLADKVVLLIDDIHTTGATLNACAKELKKAGALAVYCATAATTILSE